MRKLPLGLTALCAFALLATTVLAALNPVFAVLGPSDITDIWHRFEIALDKRKLDAAVATGDEAKWRPIMGEARHFNVPREKGIALLRQYLDYPDAQVRAAAAAYLFELGSREGGPVLVALLKDAAAGKPAAVDLALIAGVLHQYRYPVDADIIYAAYQKSPSSSLLMYVQLLGSPLAIPESEQRLKKLGMLDGALMMAGLMRLNDPESMAIYEANFKSSNATRREQASWALYRVTGDQKYLDYLVEVAEEKVRLRPRSDKSGADAGPVAFMALQQSVVPQATEALRRIEAKARTTGLSVEASRALLGLFYFHHDYEYVDRLIMAQFTGTLPKDGLLIGSIWDLAAARRTPEIEAAAKAYNREAYEREFIRKEGRPVESWIFQYIAPYIPADVRPPLKQ